MKHPAQDFDSLRNNLKLKSLEARNEFSSKHSHAVSYLQEKGIDLGKLREHSTKLLSAGALASSLLLSSPSMSLELKPQSAIVVEQDQTIQNLKTLLPEKTRPLTREEEKTLEKLLTDNTGIKVKATLEGEHLNTTYGLIGAEQHLKRFPGDTLANHGSGVILKEGIAPGLGGWGYFARNETALTPELVETEKWYAVVQTLYLPDWKRRLRYLIDWYKYRKVLIVNTTNGNAVVCAIADAGPAAWTGKSFGGSPEVMYSLGGARYKKGPVLLFFVDDPENKIPLGPVDYNKTNVQNIL